MIKTKTLIIASLFSSIVLGNLTAYAETPVVADDGRFTVYPTYEHNDNKSWIILNAKSGRETTDFITLENLSSTTQNLDLSIREAKNEKNKFIPIETTTFKNLGMWTQLPQTKYTLEPHEKVKIPVTITIPQDAEAGQYDGVIYAVKEQMNPGNVKIVTRIGVRMYISVNSPNILETNVLNNLNYKNSFFFILSLIGVMGAALYNLIHFLENKKYEKHHA